MLTVATGTSSEVEQDIKRSRFIALLCPAASEAAAREVISARRRQFPDARHHCSAFILQSDGATPQMRFSDDGEPNGTAGAPILDALRGAGLTNVVAVVTRYFGGTLLGTGGLVRAYSGSTQAAIQNAQLAKIENCPSFSVALDPFLAGRAEAELRSRGWTVEKVTWGEIVSIDFSVPQNEEGEVEPFIAQQTGGKGKVKRRADRFLEVLL